MGDQSKFPQLKPNMYLKKFYYEKSSVTCLQPMKWVAEIECEVLFNVFWVPYFSCNMINTIRVHYLLALVHDGCH